MYLSELATALTERLRSRVANGEISERRLARLTQLSQPHIHNVLKGKKALSLQACDRIMVRLGMTVYDLVSFPDGVCAGCPQRKSTVEVPLLQGSLGPGLPLPRVPDPLQSFPFRASFIATLEGAAVVRLAEDPRMADIFRPNDLVLLDQSRHRRRQLESGGYYVINRRGEGIVRRLWAGPGRGELLVGDQTGIVETVRVWPATGEHMLDIVRARVVWVGRYLLAG
ncbi:MAG: helix-turn-helix domain-containing protein [Bryobacteraceae bacterium]|nr:helix-turn-helix domain-containing protein [Bryobacteraceae bacterium]